MIGNQDLTTKAPMPPGIDPSTLPPKPYTVYTIFFRLERAYALQTTEGMVDDEALLHDPNHVDALEFPRPEKYKHVKLPPYWYSAAHKREIEKKRKHRKREGRSLDFRTLTKLISAAWRDEKLDPAIPLYCQMLSQAEVEKYDSLVGMIANNVPAAKPMAAISIPASLRSISQRADFLTARQAGTTIPDGTMTLIPMNRNMASASAAAPLPLPPGRQNLNALLWNNKSENAKEYGGRSDVAMVHGRNATADSLYRQNMLQSYQDPMNKMKMFAPAPGGQNNMMVSNSTQASAFTSAARIPVATTPSSLVLTNGNIGMTYSGAANLATAHQRQSRLKSCSQGMDSETGLGLLAYASKLQTANQKELLSTKPDFRVLAVPTKRKQQDQEGGRVAKVTRHGHESIVGRDQSDDDVSLEHTECPSIRRFGDIAKSAAAASTSPEARSPDAPIAVIEHNDDASVLEEDKNRAAAVWKDAAIASEEMLQKVVIMNYREVIALQDRVLASMRQSLEIATQGYSEKNAEIQRLRAKNADLELSTSSLAQVLASRDEEIAMLRTQLVLSSARAPSEKDDTKITPEDGSDLEQLSKLGPKVNKKILGKMRLALRD